jgi:hypothetical protein
MKKVEEVITEIAVPELGNPGSEGGNGKKVIIKKKVKNCNNLCIGIAILACMEAIIIVSLLIG